MPSNARILVVDDEPKICTMLAAALQREGCSVDACDDAVAAFERFRSAPYDLVVTDLRMPGINGFDLIHQLKEMEPDTIVIAITGHATVDTAVQALQKGADDYVTKPLDINELRRMVESSLQNRQLIVQAQAAPATEAAGAQAPPPPEPSPAQDVLAANRDLERQVAELVAVQELSQAVSGELQLSRLLETCLSAVGEATGARIVSILLVDPSVECLVVRARHGRNGNGAHVVGERRRIGRGIAGWVAEHRVPLLIDDIAEQPAFRQLARGAGYATPSFAAVPLLFDEQLVGVLCATDKRDGSPFGERDLRLLLGVAPQMAIALDNARLYEQLQANALTALRGLAESFEAKDGFSRGHSARVADLATRVAEALGLPAEQIDTLRLAAHLHDIGKLAVSDTVLTRAERLSADDLAAIREHPVRGERLLHALGFLDAVCPVVRHHHERWDGEGYPDGLQGRSIDPLTRILSVADAYEAMTSPRPHRPAKAEAEALSELARGAGTQFDPSLIEPFKRAVAGLA